MTRRVVAMLLAVLSGAIVGIVVDRAVVRKEAPPPAVRAAPPHGARPAGSARVAQRMGRELGLDPAQERRVDSILARQQRATESVLREVQPRIAAVRASTDSALRLALTPAQWDSLVARRERRRERDST